MESGAVEFPSFRRDIPPNSSAAVPRDTGHSPDDGSDRLTDLLHPPRCAPAIMCSCGVCYLPRSFEPWFIPPWSTLSQHRDSNPTLKGNMEHSNIEFKHSQPPAITRSLRLPALLAPTLNRLDGLKRIPAQQNEAMLDGPPNNWILLTIRFSAICESNFLHGIRPSQPGPICAGSSNIPPPT